VLAYLRSQGLAESTPNVTVTSFGRHPHIEGNGYVPYYAVFDHRGRLIRDHMCGDYHGGDGLRFIEVVEAALEAAPGIYLGEEPFVVLADQAQQVEAGRGLGAVLEELDGLIADGGEGQAEAERLRAAIVGHVDRRLASVDSLMATAPEEVLPACSELARSLAGSALGEQVEARYRELRRDRALKDAISVARALAKAKAKLGGLRACKSCRRDGTRDLQVDCASCRADHARVVAGLGTQLARLVRQHPDLPITKRVEAYLERLQLP
jgi:hypothetical protein